MIVIIAIIVIIMIIVIIVIIGIIVIIVIIVIILTILIIMIYWKSEKNQWLTDSLFEDLKKYDSLSYWQLQIKRC